MDVESHFIYSGAQMPSNAGFYASAGGDAPPQVKYRPERKYSRKLLVWLAMSPRGITRPVIMPSAGNVTGEVYREKCLKGVLLPFIESKYSNHDVLFWPELAIAHYALQAMMLLEEDGVPVVARDMNPPCAPQIRPIEDLWGLIKQNIYKGGRQATSDAQLKRRIQQVVRDIDPEVPRKMMAGLPARVRLAAERGLIAQIH